MINSLSFGSFELEHIVISPNVSKRLAIIAYLIVPRLAPALAIVWLLGRTSSSIVRSVERTLYYIGVACQIMYEQFPQSKLSL